MGLDYQWFSTMWGVYIFAGAALSSMCVLVLIVTALRGAGYLQQVVNLEHYHIMGKLMLSFTIFWAYIGFSQYMLIWYSNIPEETVYFLRRNTASWWYLSQFMVVGHFFVPFLLLLFQRAKKTPTFLCGMAVWILLMHMLDIYIVVLPACTSREFGQIHSTFSAWWPSVARWPLFFSSGWETLRSSRRAIRVLESPSP